MSRGGFLSWYKVAVKTAGREQENSTTYFRHLYGRISFLDIFILTKVCHVTVGSIDIKLRTRLLLGGLTSLARLVNPPSIWKFLRTYFGYFYGRISFCQYFILAVNVTWCGYHATGAWRQKCIFFENVENLLSTVSWQNFNLGIFISDVKNRGHVTWTCCDATWQKCILSEKREPHFRRFHRGISFLRILILDRKNEGHVTCTTCDATRQKCIFSKICFRRFHGRIPCLRSMHFNIGYQN